MTLLFCTLDVKKEDADSSWMTADEDTEEEEKGEKEEKKKEEQQEQEQVVTVKPVARPSGWGRGGAPRPVTPSGPGSAPRPRTPSGRVGSPRARAVSPPKSLTPSQHTRAEAMARIDAALKAS